MTNTALQERLRWYQRKACQDVLQSYMLDGMQRVVIEMPTGGGKTLTCFALIDLFFTSPGMRALIVLPSISLVKQTYDALLTWFPKQEVGLIWTDYNELGRRITIASIDTLEENGRLMQVKRDVGDGYDIVVYDEAHGVLCNKYWKVANTLEHENTLRLGMTATPYRNDGRSLQQFFTDGLVSYVDILDLIAQGYLVRPKTYLIDTNLDLSNVVQTNRTESEEELDSLLSSPSKRLSTLLERSNRYEKAFQGWAHIAQGARTLIFANDIADAYRFRDYFIQQDAWVEVITGKTGDTTRESVFKAYHEGDLRVIINYDVLTTGIDLVRTQCLIVGRLSLLGEHPNKGLHQQIIGRGLRLSDEVREDGSPLKTHCDVLYLTDTQHRHPPIILSMGMLTGTMHVLSDESDSERKKLVSEDEEPFEDVQLSEHNADELLLSQEADSEALSEPQEQEQEEKPSPLVVRLAEVRAEQFNLFTDGKWVRDPFTREYRHETRYGTLVASPEGLASYSLSLVSPITGHRRNLPGIAPNTLYSAQEVLERGTHWLLRKQEEEKMAQGQQTGQSTLPIRKEQLVHLHQQRVLIVGSEPVTQGVYFQVAAHLKKYKNNFTKEGGRAWIEHGKMVIKDAPVYVPKPRKPRIPKTPKTPTQKRTDESPSSSTVSQ